MKTLKFTLEEIIAIKKMCAYYEEYDLAIKFRDAEQKLLKKIQRDKSDIYIHPLNNPIAE